MGTVVYEIWWICSISIIIDSAYLFVDHVRFQEVTGCVSFIEYEICVGFTGFQERSNWLCCPKGICIAPIIIISTFLRLGNCLVLSCGRLWQWRTFSYLLAWLIMMSHGLCCLCESVSFEFSISVCLCACVCMLDRLVVK